MEKVTLTVKELAQYMGISLPMAYELTERSDFPLIRLGRKKVVPVEQLQRWMDEECKRKEI